MYEVLTKREVKMAGYRPSYLNFCIFMDWDQEEVSKITKKIKINIQLP